MLLLTLTLLDFARSPSPTCDRTSSSRPSMPVGVSRRFPSKSSLKLAESLSLSLHIPWVAASATSPCSDDSSNQSSNSRRSWSPPYGMVKLFARSPSPTCDRTCSSRPSMPVGVSRRFPSARETVSQTRPITITPVAHPLGGRLCDVTVQ